MVILEKITEMKRQGLPTNQIIQNLKEQGVSPKEINEALSQSEIKSEISSNVFPEAPQQNVPSNLPPNQNSIQPGQATQPTDSNSQMQPSIGQPTNQPSIQQSPQQPIQQPPSPQLEPPPFDYQRPESGVISDFQQPYQQSTQDVSQYSEYDPNYSQADAYSQDAYYPDSYQGSDIETINDIASQIVEEKTKNIKKEIEAVKRFRKDTEEKVNHSNDRLEKIEKTLEELQLAIIKKIGEYGEDVKSLSKEMKATQDSFSKIINPLTDKARKSKSKTTSKKSKKSKDSFEDYLR